MLKGVGYIADDINYALLTGLNASNTLLNNTANNVVNINAANYGPLETTMHDSTPSEFTAITVQNDNIDRVDLSQEAVNMIIEETGFGANVEVL